MDDGEGCIAMLVLAIMAGIFIAMMHSCTQDVTRKDAIRCHHAFTLASTTAESSAVAIRDNDCIAYLRAVRGDSTP